MCRRRRRRRRPYLLSSHVCSLFIYSRYRKLHQYIYQYFVMIVHTMTSVPIEFPRMFILQCSSYQNLDYLERRYVDITRVINVVSKNVKGGGGRGVSPHIRRLLLRL